MRVVVPSINNEMSPEELVQNFKSFLAKNEGFKMNATTRGEKIIIFGRSFTQKKSIQENL